MLSEAQARELLQAAGDTIEVEPAQPLPNLVRPKVWPMLVAAAAVVAVIGTTLAIADRGTSPPPPGTPTSPAPTPIPTPTLAADQLVAWARGSSGPPEFADEVRYLVNDGVVRKMSGTNATRRGWWKVCYSGVPLGCPSPLDTLDAHEGDVVQTGSPAVSCITRRSGRLPKDLADLERVRLDQPEAKDCSDAWAIELWVDAAGRIAAINQLPGSAAPPA